MQSGAAASPNRRRPVGAVVVLIAVITAAVAGYYFFVPAGGQADTSSKTASSGVVQVVAAENFWGSLAVQLGGTHSNVTSIVTDPNADPHEYETSAADARAISSADLVIVNGAGYDTWALSQVSTAGNPNQEVLNVQLLLHQPLTANPHFWYSPYYVNDTVRAIYEDYVKLDPPDASYFAQQYAALNSSLAVYNTSIHEIASQFAGTRVASTEDIFVYLANATGLDLVSPVPFMQAVAEGNDPPAASVVQFQELLQNRSVSALVFNSQTVTPLTDSIKALASQQSIPTVAITETIQPPSLTFQAWMNGELTQLQAALSSSASG